MSVSPLMCAGARLPQVIVGVYERLRRTEGGMVISAGNGIG